MEETKLDKAVDKLFRFTEKSVNIFLGLRQNFYFDLVRFIFASAFLILIVYNFQKRGYRFSLALNLVVVLSIFFQIFTSLRVRLYNTPDIDLKILKFTQKLYSAETIQFCFEPLIADWKKERKDSIEQGKTWQADWITIRYLLAFVVAMIQQSWFGRLFEIIFKK